MSSKDNSVCLCETEAGLNKQVVGTVAMGSDLHFEMDFYLHTKSAGIWNCNGGSNQRFPSVSVSNGELFVTFGLHPKNIMYMAHAANVYPSINEWHHLELKICGKNGFQLKLDGQLKNINLVRKNVDWNAYYNKEAYSNLQCMVSTIGVSVKNVVWTSRANANKARAFCDADTCQRAALPARLAKQQCVVGNDGNPIFGGSTSTLAECLERCDTEKDSKGRACVAIEWTDGGKVQPTTTKKGCALAWGCDSTVDWTGGSVFKRMDSAAALPVTPFDSYPISDPLDYPLSDPFDPLVPSESYWFGLNYTDLLMVLCGALVVLCGLNLYASVQRKQRPRYAAVKTVFDSDIDIEAKPINN